MDPNPRIQYTIKLKGKPLPGEVSLGEFMDVKGWKAAGNKLCDQMLSAVKQVESPPASASQPPVLDSPAPAQQDLFSQMAEETPPASDKQSYKPGDVIEF